MDSGRHPSVILVTGGAGFIGSAVIRHLLADTDALIVNFDKLTYAANLAALAELENQSRHRFVKACVTDGRTLREILAQYRPDAVMHLAAESHVDRSIDGPSDFVATNIVGTSVLLEAVREYLAMLPKAQAADFRFHHISTDEVFGSLPATGKFSETTPYAPTSPYSASKAGSDHLVRAWHATYGLPAVLSNCSNNYGPWQFPEKLIPLMILKALKFEPLPVYGNGGQVRDWLHVEDHARALHSIVTRGRIGETYMVGGNCERRNLEVVEAICDLVDRLAPSERGPRRKLISFVQDRPGHDARYAVDTGKIARELGWGPKVEFASGLASTVRWYVERSAFWRDMTTYRGERLGTLAESVS